MPLRGPLKLILRHPWCLLGHLRYYHKTNSQATFSRPDRGFGSALCLTICVVYEAVICYYFSKEDLNAVYGKNFIRLFRALRWKPKIK